MSNSRRWLRKVRAWSRMPRRERWLLLELAGELARAGVEVSLMPDRVYARAVGQPQLASEPFADDPVLPTSETLLLANSVRAMTASLSRALPWKCSCLMQALAARRVLSRRDCRTQLSLGVRRSGARMEAHAWLSHGEHVVTGDSPASDFSPLARFDA